MRNAQRPPKVPFFIREIRLNALRRTKPFSVIFQIPGPAPFPAALRALAHYHRRGYHPADLFLAHLFAIVSGIGRIENAQSLIHNGLIPSLLGLPEFPHRDTLRSFLWRFGSQDLHSLVAAHDRLRQELFLRLGLFYSAIVDADTTALITYGSQEGTAVGCLPEEVQHWNISTLRRELWWLPAKWVRRDNRNLLMLPAKYTRQDLFLKIQQAASKVRPLI